MKVTEGPATQVDIKMKKKDTHTVTGPPKPTPPPLPPLKNILHTINTFSHNKTINFIEPKSFKHQTYQDIETYVYRLGSKHPEIVHAYSAGKSEKGHDLWVVELSDNPGRHEAGEPDFKFIGNIHGDDVSGTTNLLTLIEFLCQNYGKNRFITQLIDSTRIHIMPTANPDGYVGAKQGKSSPYTPVQ
jgi:carboxypeptidase D